MYCIEFRKGADLMKKAINNTPSINEIINAEDYIIQTFQNCNIIGLGEGGHHLENSHHFFQKMFDNKKIQEIINIVIVEFANTDYQDILDRYILGEEVPINELRKVWRESTQSVGRFGEATIYFELLEKIRTVNLSLSENNKIRVLGGDPPIDWKAVNSLEDYNKSNSQRDIYPAELAIEYGINRSMKVLVIYAEYHITKIIDKTASGHPSITTYVNDRYPGAMKVIAVLDPQEFQLEEQTKNWPLYSIIDLDMGEICNLPAEKYFTQLFNKEGRVTLFEGYKIKELFDAFLYVGPSSSWKRVDFPKSVFSDDEWNKLNRRRKILGNTPLDDKLRN